MKPLTEQQEKFLCLIGKNINKSVSELGRKIYSTNKSCYDVIYLFQEEGLIDLESKKNLLIPKLTIKGQKFVERIINAKDL